MIPFGDENVGSIGICPSDTRIGRALVCSVCGGKPEAKVWSGKLATGEVQHFFCHNCLVDEVRRLCFKTEPLREHELRLPAWLTNLARQLNLF